MGWGDTPLFYIVRILTNLQYASGCVIILLGDNMKRFKKILISVVVALSALMACIAFGLGIIHITGFIYDIDLEVLDIPENSGYSKDLGLENYDYVMDYLAPFNDEEFELPSMRYSEVGSVHFEDCRVLFNIIYLIGAVCFIILVLTLIFIKDRVIYKLSGILTLGLPLSVGLAIMINFEWAFTLFHKILFNDQNWIFDPRYDPIISILPAEFFMHCGLFIALVVVLGAFGLFIRGCVKK